MSAQEFILIPKENYIKNQPKASQILDDPTITAKSQQLTVLQRVPEKKETRKTKSCQDQVCHNTKNEKQRKDTKETPQER